MRNKKKRTLPKENLHSLGERATATIKNLVPISLPVSTFPATFDLREEGRVTPVHDMVACGSCWTTAAIGCLESFLCPHENWDFSEDHLQIKMIGSCSAGASHVLATNYLVSWLGPVREADFDYQNPSTPTVVKHCQKVYFLPVREDALDNGWIKYAITYFGGVYSDISSTGLASYEHNTYYDPHDSIVHAIVLVGWDDNMPKELFTNHDHINDEMVTPPGNGAFIARNNKGTDFGEGGYYYISYYDASVTSGATVFTADKKSNYSHIYQYDLRGMDSLLCVLEYAANIFTATDDDELVAVGFYGFELPGEIKIEIYVNPGQGPVDSSGPDATVYTTLPMNGFYTVELPQRINLNAGQKFSVVLSTSDPNGFNVSLDNQQGGIGHLVQPGQCYIKWKDEFGEIYPQGWTDLTTYKEDASLCIKAYTKSFSYTLPGVNTSIIKDFDNDFVMLEVTNTSSKDISIKPLVRAYAKKGNRLILPAQYALAGRKKIKLQEGIVKIAAGQTVKVLTAAFNAKTYQKMEYSLEVYDVTKDMYVRIVDWTHVGIVKSRPKVVSTTPTSNQQINYPSLDRITVTFNKNIKMGPNFHNIKVTSPIDFKFVFCSIEVDALIINTVGPLAPRQLGGVQWTVKIPKDAVLDMNGNSLAKDYSWNFTTIGVN
ncbi:MAG: lectin like domain-containing protein [Desulforhopalus sp.]|nr:lectin like domain-containing protein [Desulforhopalus sp.]